MDDKLDRGGAAEFAIRCAGFVGDQKTLHDDTKDKLIAEGVANAIANLALVCAELNGTSFEDMVADAKALFDREFDAERSWVWRLMLESGGGCVDTRGDLIEVYCDGDDERDQLSDDLRFHKVRFTVEPAPDEPETYIVLIERGFLARVSVRSDRSAG